MDNLPVELVYEIQLCALEPVLPLVCRRLYAVFDNASSLFRSQYLLSSTAHADRTPATTYSAALRYPLCTQPVFARLIEQRPPNNNDNTKEPITLPKRLFRTLSPNDAAQTDALVDFLRFMTSHPTLPPINANSHDGYVLTRAVYARSPQLVSLLLDHNANPRKRANLAVKVAIRQKDVQMLKLLLESRATAGGSGGRGGVGKDGSNKRRKIKHRITPDATMLRLAVDSGAEEIVAYLYRELRVVPDLETLKRITL